MATDRGIVLALLVGMFANGMFTDELGAPANAMCTWLFVLLAWVGIMSSARARSTARNSTTRTDLVPVIREGVRR
jgi:hypothetical protein